MRVLLSAYDSRGGVEPLVGLAVRCAGVAAVAGPIRPDGATAAATLLLDAVSLELMP